MAVLAAAQHHGYGGQGYGGQDGGHAVAVERHNHEDEHIDYHVSTRQDKYTYISCVNQPW